MRKRETGQSELLSLLSGRKTWALPPFKRPQWNAKDLERINDAVKVHGQAYPSDPFAARRMLLHLLCGLDDANAVNVAATRLVLSRQRRALDAAE